MEHVFEHIRDSGSMVVLADANGLLLETVGDADFVDRADRIALAPLALRVMKICAEPMQLAPH